MIGLVDAIVRALAGDDVTSPVPLPPRVALRTSRLIPALGGRLSGMGGPAAAVTLGRTVVVHPDVTATARLIRHELAHVAQWERHPITFPIHYIRAHIRHGYRNNPYEREAREAEAVPAEPGGSGMSRSVVTISRHIVEQERLHPHATGAFSNILNDMALAAKLISREVNHAGLVDILGATDQTNVHGEVVKKLDEYADEVIFKAFDHTGLLCCMASEENEDILEIPAKFPTGKYSLLYDPLDGSSNIDANVSVGTIFSVHRKVSSHPRGCAEDCIQTGRKQLAAGYIVYGSSTMLVYTTGNGVHGFTLDPSIGEFLLSHPDIRIPTPGQRIYSVNEGNYGRWSDGQRRLVDHLKGLDATGTAFSSRYVGSMVADLHRTLLYGGLFMYPADGKHPGGKLRLLYEANPMAFITEQAGGRATDGRRDILDIEPTSLHERTPLYIGSTEFVELAQGYVAEDAAAAVR